MQSKTSVLLDVDTGYDDALALLLAFRSPELAVRGITCVAGNHGLKQVVANTQKILDVLAAGDVPVAAGAETPMFEPMREPTICSRPENAPPQMNRMFWVLIWMKS